MALAPNQPTDAVPAPVRLAASWSWRLLVIGAVIAAFGFLVWYLHVIVIPVLIAILLAALLVPFCTWLQRHGWPRWLAIAVCEVGIILVIAGLVTLVVFQVRGALPELQAQTATRYADFVAWLGNSPLQLSEQDIATWFDGLWASLQGNLGGIAASAGKVGETALKVLTGVLITLFTTLFLLIDGRRIWNWILKLFPRAARPAVGGAGVAGWATLTSFVRVQVFVAFVDAVGISLGAWILGLFAGGFPLVIPIGIAVFLGSFIPVVGAVITGVIAVFVALVYLGPLPALIMLGVVILVQQVEGHVLQPFVMGTAVKVHPLAVVLAVAVGGTVGGIPGALFAVPFVATLNVMVLYVAQGEWRAAQPPSAVAEKLAARTRSARPRAGSTRPSGPKEAP